MTTSVTILIDGNKACEVRLEGGALPPVVVRPKGFTILMIHSEQKVVVQEIGPFIEGGN